MLFLKKLKTVVPVALLATGLFACVALAAGSLPPPPIAATPAAPVMAVAEQPAACDVLTALPKGPNKLVYYQNMSLATIDPGGTNETKLKHLHVYPGWIRLSPDGKTVAVLGTPKPVAGAPPVRVPPPSDSNLFVRGVNDPGTVIDLNTDCRAFAWSPDGSQIAASGWPEGSPDKQIHATHWLIDVETRGKKALKLPENHVVVDWSADGTHLLTKSSGQKDDKFLGRINLMNLDGTEHKVLVRETTGHARLSPDGTRLLYSMPYPPEAKKQYPDLRLQVMEIATGKTTPVPNVPADATLPGLCWSPDGKQIAYVWREVRGKGTPEQIETNLVVSDLAGKNLKTIVSVKANPAKFTMGVLDWR
jgi:Tol biopolymer transport system component